MSASKSLKSRRLVDRALSLDTAISRNVQLASQQVVLLKRVRFAESQNVVRQSPQIEEGSEATIWYTVSSPLRNVSHYLLLT
jgi:hypothetical protein